MPPPLLRQACRSAVYLILKSMSAFTSDGRFILHHDPVFRCRRGRKHEISRYSLEDLSLLRYQNGEGLLSLRAGSWNKWAPRAFMKIQELRIDIRRMMLEVLKRNNPVVFFALSPGILS